MPEKLLSILIPTLSNPTRQSYLARLMNDLGPQVARMTDEVEVLTEVDNGQLQIGTKRNWLVSRSKGKFIAFVDDDDAVALDYVQRITDAIRENPDIDCVGMQGTFVVDERFEQAKPFYHSIAYPAWREEKGVYYRPPNHLNPIRRDHVLATPFKEISFGEDKDYSERIYPLLKKEKYLQGSLYLYLFRREKKEMQK